MWLQLLSHLVELAITILVNDEILSHVVQLVLHGHPPVNGLEELAIFYVIYI